MNIFHPIPFLRNFTLLSLYATRWKVAGSRPTEVNELFSIYLILPAVLGPRVYSVCSRNECQKQINNVSGE
jgi:hypothetical protein